MEFEDVHLIVLIITAVVILYSDHQGFDYMRGKKEVLSPTSVGWSHRLVSLGLLLMILTGVLLVLPAWQYWLSNPIFYVKMGFVMTLLINGFFISKLSHVATETPFASLNTDTRTTLIVSGGLSAIGWLGAAAIGLFFL